MGDLRSTLERSRALGFLGPGPVEDHITHAERFATAFPGEPPARALDLGSGGGVPGLILAGMWPSTTWWLLDANQRRTAFLKASVEDLGLQDRVQVVHGRAETCARETQLRGQMNLVTSRSFGPPAVTAECASAFLCVGGSLIVSEPPTPDDGPASDSRWDAAGLAILGMEPEVVLAGCQVLRQTSISPDRYPRRVGIPAKRPLF
ncbi:MAG TPA: RsmG family class I SAM-dependent methyltransferase [Acidimicrobiales bacterium]